MMNSKVLVSVSVLILILLGYLMVTKHQENRAIAAEQSAKREEAIKAQIVEEKIKNDTINKERAEKERLDKENERLAEEKVLQDLMTLKKPKALTLLDQCKSKILEKAKADNKGPFGVFIVDEYTSDIDQFKVAMKGGRVTSNEDRVKTMVFFREKYKKDKDINHKPTLDMFFYVMFISDSFSGPIREPKRYYCKMKPGLILEVQ